MFRFTKDLKSGQFLNLHFIYRLGNEQSIWRKSNFFCSVGPLSGPVCSLGAEVWACQCGVVTAFTKVMELMFETNLGQGCVDTDIPVLHVWTNERSVNAIQPPRPSPSTHTLSAQQQDSGWAYQLLTNTITIQSASQLFHLMVDISKQRERANREKAWERERGKRDVCVKGNRSEHTALRMGWVRVGVRPWPCYWALYSLSMNGSLSRLPLMHLFLRLDFAVGLSQQKGVSSLIY